MAEYGLFERDVNEVLRQSAERIARYIDDLAEMRVTTTLIEPTTGRKGINEVATVQSTIRLDGDSQSTIPLTNDEKGNPMVNSELYELHQMNIKAVTAYRAQTLQALLTILPTDQLQPD